MNKGIAYLAILFILGILVSVVVGTAFIGQVKAWSTPHELDGFIPATINIAAPQNTTYTGSVPINFVVTSGEGLSQIALIAPISYTAGATVIV